MLLENTCYGWWRKSLSACFIVFSTLCKPSFFSLLVPFESASREHGQLKPSLKGCWAATLGTLSNRSLPEGPCNSQPRRLLSTKTLLWATHSVPPPQQQSQNIIPGMFILSSVKTPRLFSPRLCSAPFLEAQDESQSSRLLLTSISLARPSLTWQGWTSTGAHWANDLLSRAAACPAPVR